MHKKTVGTYLRSCGYSPQKPLRRAYAQNPEKIQKWLKEEYSTIVDLAKRENAEIQWNDESGISSSCQVGTTFAPKGQTPVVKQPGRRFAVSMISTVTNQGALRFMVYEGGLNIDIFLKFLRRFIEGQKRKVFLILDNLKVHHGIKVQNWVEKHKEAIELFLLPPYVPEYNPDEYLITR